MPPDRRGLIAAADSLRLGEFGRWLGENFPEELGGTPVDLPYPKTVNCAVIEEDISKGQRVEEFAVEGLVNGQWKPLASGTTIGIKRMLMFDPVTVDSLRLDIRQSRRTPDIAGFRGLMVNLPPEENAETLPALPEGVTSTVSGTTCTLSFPNPATLAGFTYAPPADAPAVFNYAAEVSTDNGLTWHPVDGLSGEFSNIQNNPIPQTVTFPSPVTSATALRLRAIALTTGPASSFPGSLFPLLR